MAAVLPVVKGLRSPVWVTGRLAAMLVVLEGAQHLYQLQPDHASLGWGSLAVGW